MKKEKLVKTKCKVGYNLLIKRFFDDTRWIRLGDLFSSRTEAHLHKNKYYPKDEYRIVGVRIDDTPWDVLRELNKKERGETSSGKNRKNKS